jgi:hypothetical protein
MMETMGAGFLGK